MKYKIDHSDKPIRLFKSDFLEFFTHISPITIAIIWVPVIIFFFTSGIKNNSGFSWVIPGSFFVGLFIWTITEYVMHRFVFHFPAQKPWQERIFYLFHGVHHHQPQCKTRLVMPLPVSIPLALVFYGLFFLVFSILPGAQNWLAPMFSGFLTGYLIYDITHYATHHFPMRSGIFKFLKQYHLKHHYKTPEQRFGVSSPIWDVVFKTYPKDI